MKSYIPTKSSIYTNSNITKDSDNNNILCNFDFSEIDSKDPSLSEGHKLIYNREVPFELRLEDKELSCENDLFFHFTSDIDEETYKIMQENQKLTVNFKEFSNLLKRLFNNCINEPQSYISVFIMQKEGTGRLDFIQNIEYKFIELLSIDFVNSPDDTVRKQIGYRYNALRTKMEMMQERIIAINNIIKIKNPSLLHQINKTPSKFNMNKSTYSSIMK